MKKLCFSLNHHSPAQAGLLVTEGGSIMTSFKALGCSILVLFVFGFLLDMTDDDRDVFERLSTGVLGLLVIWWIYTALTRVVLSS